MEKRFNFPERFLWGTATSSHQIEGGNINDWSSWEKSRARLEKLIEQGKNPDDFISGKACNSYKLYEEDIKCIKELNNNAYRFSLEWSRIEPEPGKFNKKAIEHYRQIIKRLKEGGIEPFVTIWHWPLPLWFRDIGGWENKKAIELFVRYGQKVTKELGGEVKYWITINEPLIYSSHFYFIKDWPPEKDPSKINYFLAVNKLIKSHKLLYQKIKKNNPGTQIGIAKNQVYFEAYKNKPANKALKLMADWWWNSRFLNSIKNHQDFIGLNHYHRNRIDYGFNKNENQKVSDMGWELYPEALYHVLKDLGKYRKPIYITENGLADREDKYRSWFISESLKNVAQAIEEKIDVRGYFYWSLLDNFEWAAGFGPKFGLYQVDFKNFKRRPRFSAGIYSEICKNNQLIIKD